MNWLKSALFLSLAVLGCLASPLEGIPDDPRIDNAFARSNPGYRFRAAQSYEDNYFGASLEQLQRALQLPPSEQARLRRNLRGFTYRWLDRYVLREGRMPAADLEELVSGWEGQLSECYGARSLAASRAWARSGSNPLYFLFRVHRDSSGPTRD